MQIKFLKNYKLIIVLQSSIEIIKNAYEDKKFPYEIISYLLGKLYTLFRINSATSKEKLATESDKLKIKNAVKMGLKKGVLEGNILQLPAEFILDEKLNLKYSYCGKTSGDILSPKELLKRLN